MNQVSEHIYSGFKDGMQTQIEKEHLFSIKLDENYDILEDIEKARELNDRSAFLEGTVKKLNQLGFKCKLFDKELILQEIKRRYKDILHIDCPKAVTDNWIKKENVNRAEAYKFNNYNFCLALEMNVDETAEFFLKNFMMIPFNYKNRVDAVYFYCMVKKKPYDVIAKMLEESESYEVLNIDSIHTNVIGRQILEIDDDEEFMQYLQAHCYDEKRQYQTARDIVIELVEENKKLIKEERKKKESITTKDLMEEIIGYYSQDQYIETHNGIRTSDLPSLFTESFPSEVLISNIITGKKVSYEVLRKSLILMKFFNFFYHLQNEEESRSSQDIRSDLEDFYAEVNSVMSECGFVQMYVRHSFDWIVLFCSNSNNPVDKFQGLIEAGYLEEAGRL